jgi:hypothetical protein
MTTTLMLPRDGYGDATFTKHWNGDYTRSWITCDHADPRIRISDMLIDQIDRGEIPEATLTLPDPVLPRLRGAVITIDCENRRLVYRITGWEPVWLEGDKECGSYLAEWPD